MPDMPRFLFDHEDYVLLDVVDDVLSRDDSSKHLKRLFDPYLHPRGIKELAASKELRIAYAVARLLESLEAGNPRNRLNALRSLREEVLFSNPSPLRLNTARLLLQIMKELVRGEGDKEHRLRLAHDFRTALSGKPRAIRVQLQRYYLLEMPEEWNQVAFDYHVHDAHTKGRKSPTHLIMDAWIKGIRFLTVIYYNYVRAEAASEIIEAAEIMGVTIRVGVECSAIFHDRYVQLIWAPRGFAGAQDFLAFLAQASVQKFMAEGRAVAEYRQNHVLDLLEEFNRVHLKTINEHYGLAMPLLKKPEFMSFVGTGQTSLVHLAEFIHANILPLMQARLAELRPAYAQADATQKQRIAELVNEMNELTSEVIVDNYLKSTVDAESVIAAGPSNGMQMPDLLKLTPRQLVTRLKVLPSGYRLILNLSGLAVEDVLELIHDCDGSITHLEMFNLKDYAFERAANREEINAFRLAMNEGNVVKLKRLIRELMQRIEASEAPDREDRLQKYHMILRDLPRLRTLYQGAPLKAYIGSDSIGRSRRLHGMGLAVIETLPPQAQREIRRQCGPMREVLPVTTSTHLCTSLFPRHTCVRWLNSLYASLRRLPFLKKFGYDAHRDWVVQDYAAEIAAPGNLVTLGGIHLEKDNRIELSGTESPVATWKNSRKYMNTGMKNVLKVVIGFLPAFATFVLTKDWWLLAYCGAFIWFGITGLRNILQAVLGGGGIRRSPLLRWKEFVSWQRIADSLLFTGISVPLLDFFIKTLLLDQLCGITIATHPVAVYAWISLANGVYLSTHSIFRGLPRAAIIGNLFRALLAVPLAVLFSAGAGEILRMAGVSNVAFVLQKWAAIISKTASDCVAGVIEGTADRIRNVHLRMSDYNSKLDQFFDTYSQLELLFPEDDILKMLESPKQFIRTVEAEGRHWEWVMLVNALDLLYFWMYQPQARSVLLRLMAGMTREERTILVRAQNVLEREKEVSQLFVDGIVGRNFSRALAFYLSRADDYLREVRALLCESR